MNKEQIEHHAAKEGIKAFKSSQENNLSLTLNGFLLCKKLLGNPYHISVKSIKSREVLKIQQVFSTPYYLDIDKRVLLHFDEFININSVFYKDNLEALLDSFL